MLARPTATNPAGSDRILAFFFRPQGRISRREYGLGTLFLLSVNLAVLAFLAARGMLEPGLVLAVAVLGLPLAVAQLVLTAKRCHDLGLPGSFVLLLFVPVFGLVWLLALFLLPGTPGPNAYGPPPRFRPD